MKPVSLEFCGINSFSEPAKIDFLKLTEFGIFGIFGERALSLIVLDLRCTEISRVHGPEVLPMSYIMPQIKRMFILNLRSNLTALAVPIASNVN